MGYLPPDVFKKLHPAAAVGAGLLGGPLGWAGLGLQLGEGVLSGIAASDAQDEEARRNALAESEDKHRFDLSTNIARNTTERTQGLQGLDFLAGQRAQALKGKRTLMFRDALLNAAGG